MTRSTHVFADVEQMAAVRTKQSEEEKHNRIRTKKNKERRRKQGTKTRNRTQAVGTRRNKSSRLCYRAEPGTLSYALPSSSYSSPQRYQGASTAAVEPPLREQINENKTKNY